MKRILLAILILAAGTPTWAATDAGVDYLQHRWAAIKYQTPEKAQEQEFKQLADAAANIAHKNPASAEALIWEGIIRATYAGARGGLGALGEVKQARKLFERAIELDPAALDGSAYTSLGSLYYQVPGFPLGFGNDKKAEEMLKLGLKYNPDGIDSNYFYGDYLLKQHRYTEALRALEKRPKRRQGRTGNWRTAAAGPKSKRPFTRQRRNSTDSV